MKKTISRIRALFRFIIENKLLISTSLNLERDNYVCIFPELMDLHSIKCTGQICENVARYHKKKTYIITYKNGDYPNFRKYCPNVKLIFLDGSREEKYRVVRILLLTIMNAKRIDILYYYYFPYTSVYYEMLGTLYKLINKRGRLHVRLEADIQDLNSSFPFVDENSWLLSIRDLVKKIFFRKVDILGVIDDDSLNLTKNIKLWDIVKNKNNIKQQLNGYINTDELQTINMEQKSNNICVAGRLTAKQKGIDILLDALKTVNLKNWHVFLLGDASAEIENAIYKLISKNTTLEGKLHLKGHISVEEYWDYLSKSRIFCLPSRHDGIPLVIPDAQIRGNLIVSSDLYGIKRIVLKKGELGVIFQNGNAEDLAEKLQYAIENYENMKGVISNSVIRAKEILNWENIVRNLEL
jgi:GalNAc-alpha-(1->4)-GalNAc-alpha-(1->3)-diNAcBac-PP-undecaprenol alpha-1,4-N-acetyl-D-galactosaminyltransferase